MFDAMKPISEVYNMDCLEYMKNIPDKFFDLCIADPPYGIGFGVFNRTNKTADGVRYKANRYHNADWDKQIPVDLIFKEIKRVSKQQIIWGGELLSDIMGKWMQRVCFLG